ncbi:hypothetical protein BVY03_02545, partial [bacterium K02(2017)]
MKTHLSEIQLKYTGQELHSHFAYQNFNLQGDSIVAFMGPCEVNLDNLVDLEDVKKKAPIFSENMLHFIIEHFNHDLNLTIAYQRLLIDLIRQEICEEEPDLKLKRIGDDLYEDMFKMTVSIATSSPVSCLIHTGINISSKNTPVATKGLEDFKINPHALA